MVYLECCVCPLNFYWMTQNGSSPGFCHAGYQPGICLAPNPMSYLWYESAGGLSASRSHVHRPSAKRFKLSRVRCNWSNGCSLERCSSPTSALKGTSKRGLNGSVRSSKSCCRFSEFKTAVPGGFQSLSLGVVGRLLDEPKAGTELERNLETPKHCSLGLQSWIFLGSHMANGPWDEIG